MSYVPVKTDEEDEVDAQGEKVVSFSKQFHTTMISLLFGISKEGNSSVWMPYIVYFVEIAQLVAFNFRPYFKWNESIVGWFISSVNAFHFEEDLGNGDTALYVAIGIFSVLIILLTFSSYIAVASQANVNFYDDWSFKCLRVCSTLSCGICFVPMLSIFCKYIFCAQNSTSMFLECTSLNFLILRVLLVVIVAAFLFISILVRSSRCVYSPFVYFSSPNPRYKLYQSLLMIVVVLASSALANDPRRWLLACVLVIVSFLYWSLHLINTPFFYLKLGIYVSSLGAIWFWSSVSLLVCISEGDTLSYSSSLLFLLFLPIVLVLNYFYFYHSLAKLQSEPIHNVSVEDISLKIRINLIQCIESVFLKNLDLKSNYDFTLEFADMCSHIDEIFAFCAEKLSKSCSLYILLATYRYFIEKNKLLALNALNLASENVSLFDEEVLIFRFRKLIDEENSNINVDVVNFVQLQRYQQESKKHDVIATRLLTQFWKQLQEHHPNVIVLDSLGSQIGEAISIAQENYEKLVIMSKNPQPFRTYAGFLLDIVNDPWRAQQLLDKATELEEAQSAVHADDALSFLDERNAIITVSGHPSSIGTILSVNLPLGKILGYAPHEITGKNVSSIAPEPYAIEHDGYLQNYLTTGHSRVVSMKRVIVVKLHNSFMAPISFLMKEVTDSETGHVSFVGVMKIYAVPDCHFLIVDSKQSPNNYITCITQSLVQFFGRLPSHTGSDGRVVRLLVNSWIPCYDEVLKLEDLSSGLTFEHRTADGRHVTFNCSVTIEANQRHIHIVCLREIHQQLEHVKTPKSESSTNSTHDLPYDYSNEDQSGAYLNPLMLEPLDDEDEYFDENEHAGLVPSPKHNFNNEDYKDHYVETKRDHNSVKNAPVLEKSPILSQKLSIPPENAPSERSVPRSVKRRASRRGTFNSSVSALSEYSDGISQGSTGLSVDAAINSIQQALRKMVGEGRHHRDSNLKFFKIVLIMAAMILGCLSLSLFLVIQSELSTYKEVINSVQTASSRTTAIIETVFHVQSLSLIQQGLLDVSWEAESRSNITSLVTLLKETQSSLYLLNSVISTNNAALYATPSVWIAELYNSVPTMKKVNLFDAIQLFISHASLIQKSPLVSCVLSNANFFYIPANGLSDLLDIANRSSYMYFDLGKDILQNKIVLLASGFLIASLVFIFFSTFCLFLPTIGRVENNKMDVLKLFSNIPPSVVQNLRSRCENRLLQNNDEAFVSSMELEDEERNKVDDMENCEPNSEYQNSHGDTNTDSGNADHSNLHLQDDADNLLESETHEEEIVELSNVGIGQGPGLLHQQEVNVNKLVYPTPKRDSRIEKKRKKKENTESYFCCKCSGCCFGCLSKFGHCTNGKFYLKIGIFVIIALTYFVVAYLSVLNLSNLLLVHEDTLFWSSQRRSYLTWSHYALRDQIVSNSSNAWSSSYFQHASDSSGMTPYPGYDPLFPSLNNISGIDTGKEAFVYNVSTVKDLFTQLAWIDESLLFGSSLMDPSIKLSTSIDLLEWSTACGSWTTSYLMYSGCVSYANGILSQGIHSSINALWIRGTDLAEAVSKVNENGLSKSLILKFMSDSSMQFVQTMEMFYLRDAVEQSRVVYYNYLSSLISNYISIQTIVLICLLLCNAIYFLVIVNPLIGELHDNSYRTRSLLLMVPSSVIQDVASIRKYILDIVKRVNS